MIVLKNYNLTFNNEKGFFCLNTIKLLGYNVSKSAMKSDSERMKTLNLPIPDNVSVLRRSVSMFGHQSFRSNEVVLHSLRRYRLLNFSAPFCHESFRGLKDKSPSLTLQLWQLFFPQQQTANSLRQSGHLVAFFLTILGD